MNRSEGNGIMGQYHIDQHSHSIVLRIRERKGKKNIFEEIMAEMSPNLGKETDIAI